jgi:hypothetical protein
LTGKGERRLSGRKNSDVKCKFHCSLSYWKVREQLRNLSSGGHTLYCRGSLGGGGVGVEGMFP